MTIRALVTNRTDAGMSSEVLDLPFDALGEGEVTVAIEWSTVNYKDGLALAGARIMQAYPMVGGIDFSGIVESSDDPAFQPGDRVMVNGFGLSQTHNGGYAQMARVPAAWVVPLPDGITTRDAMAIGTAGYTAMLSVMALEHGGATPDWTILVTGANGGVGSISIALLSGLGYRVIASTGRAEHTDYLLSLGATEIIDRAELSAPGAPIAKERWNGAIDSVGSHTLANALAHTAYGGVVAACGLAQGMDLPGSVAPFILRNVTLAGIDSVNAPQTLRREAWRRLARDLAKDKLLSTVGEIGLSEVPDIAGRILQGLVRGRTVVDVNR
jgi:acrylyl-CoA reductase (NADPH)